VVKELAAELRMSSKSIQPPYRKGQIPVQGCVAWRGSVSRKSDGRWNGTEEAACIVSTVHRHSRARPAARREEKSPDGKTGARIPSQAHEGQHCDVRFTA